MGSTEVADLFVKLSLLTDPFAAGTKSALLNGDSLITKMGGVGAAMTKLGAATAVAGLGIGAVSVKMAADFETQMTRLYTAAGAPKDAVKAATDQVLQMGNEVGQTGTAMAEALYHPVSAGLDLATSLNAVREAAKEAAISGASLDDTTYALSSVMKAFNQDGSQAHDTMALLNSIVGQGDMRFQDFNTSVKNWAPTAATMGISIQSMGAALAYLTDRGNTAEEASTRLTMGLTMMSTPSKQAGKLLEGLGVASADVQASTENMTAVLRKSGITQNELAADLAKPDGIYVALTHLKNALHDAGVSGTEADSVLAKVFGGGRSDKAIMSLMSNLDGVKTKFDDIGTGVKGYDQAWADTQATFNFKMKQTQAELSNLAIKIGSVLIPVVEAVVGWFDRNKVAAEVLAGVVGTVLTASLLRFAMVAAESTIKTISDLVGSFTKLGTTAKTTAAEEEAAATSAGGMFSKIGKGLPMIGLAVTGIGMLADKLGQMSGVGDHTALQTDQVTSSILSMAEGSAPAKAQLDQLALGLAGMGQVMGHPVQGMKDLDATLASIVSSGDTRSANAAFNEISMTLQDKMGKSVDDVMKLFPQFENSLKATSNSATEASNVAKTTGSSIGGMAGPISDTTDATQGLDTAVGGLTDTLNTLTGHINVETAWDKLRKDIMDVSGAINTNGQSLDISTEKGLANHEAFVKDADSITKMVDALQKNGQFTDANRAQLANLTDQLIKNWEQTTGNKKAVDALAESLGLPEFLKGLAIPVDTTAIDAALNKVNSLANSINQGNIGKSASGVTYKAAGGWVHGPGTTTSDSIEARLSDKEFVVDAAGAAATPPGVLEALNQGNVGLARSLLGGAGGAPSYGVGSAPGGGYMTVVNNYFTIMGSLVAQADLERAVTTATLQGSARNSNNGLTYRR